MDEILNFNIRIYFVYIIENFFWFNFVGFVFGNKDFFVGLGIFLDIYSNYNGFYNVSLKNN